MLDYVVRRAEPDEKQIQKAIEIFKENVKTILIKKIGDVLHHPTNTTLTTL
jgi:hypothetical protein